MSGYWEVRDPAGAKSAPVAGEPTSATLERLAATWDVDVDELDVRPPFRVPPVRVEASWGRRRYWYHGARLPDCWSERAGETGADVYDLLPRAIARWGLLPSHPGVDGHYSMTSQPRGVYLGPNIQEAVSWGPCVFRVDVRGLPCLKDNIIDRARVCPVRIPPTRLAWVGDPYKKAWT
jgi:hypothetical protein